MLAVAPAGLLPVVGGGHQRLTPPYPGAAAPKPLMNMNAMIATQMKISTEIADPMPRLSAVNRLS